MTLYIDWLEVENIEVLQSDSTKLYFILLSNKTSSIRLHATFKSFDCANHCAELLGVSDADFLPINYSFEAEIENYFSLLN